jgi:hypothetical protein
MPPKKKDATTCDVGTDPPDPVDYDPFNVHGRRLRAEFQSFPIRTKKIIEKLQQQNTSGAPKEIRDDVIDDLERMLSFMEGFSFDLDQSMTISNRLQIIEREICDTKATVMEIKDATKEIPQSAKTWAQITATNGNNNDTTTAQAKRRELNEVLRKQREPCQAALTTTNDETTKTLTDMHAREITKRCQDTIDAETTQKPKLNGINKIANGIRLQCKSPEDAQIVCTVNWNSALKVLWSTNRNTALSSTGYRSLNSSH